MAAIESETMKGREGSSELPRLRDRSMLSLLVFAALLSGLSWSTLTGYQLADSVEYMERAESFARGEAQDPSGAVRSFGFSLLLSPFFYLQELTGLEDTRPVVWAVRLWQMLLGLGLVFACTRLGARLFGRGAGLVAGFVVACNPIFLQYAVSPVSGVAAALCVALALDALLVRGSPRRAFVGGLWLGAGFLMAYQTVLIAGPLILALALRDRIAHWRRPLAALGGVMVFVALQVVLDRLTWGEWGTSLLYYLVANSGSIVVRMLVDLGFDETARQVYEKVLAMQGLTSEAPDSAEVRQLQSKFYYVRGVTSMLVWPVLAMLALGLFRTVRRPRWSTSILVLLLAVNVVIMSLKGSKSFRLWLPLLPMIAPLCGYGLVLLARRADGRPSVARAALVALILAAALGLSLRTLLALNTRQYGAYWSAMELVNRRLAEEGERTAPARVASAYHWAAYKRGSPQVVLEKLPHHLNRWLDLEAEQRAACLEELAEMDWLFVHEPVLGQEQTLFDAVNERFALVDIFWDEDTHDSLGPVYVMRARRGPGELLLTETLPPEDPAAYRARLGLDRGLPAPMDFAGQGATNMEYSVRMTLLGVELRRLPESDLSWITYHWTAATGLPANYRVIDRLSPKDGAHAWQNNHGFAHGFRPTSEWVPGQILRESYPVLAGSLPFSADFEPLGGAYRRGDLAPVELFMTVIQVERDDEGEPVYVGSLRPSVSGAPRPLDMSRPTELPGGLRRSAEGFDQSPDSLVRLTGFLVPVLERYRWPDDGRPDPP